MYVGRPRKILRTIYLYTAIPLLLVTAVLAMTSLMHHRHHRNDQPAEVKADQPPEWSRPAGSGSGASEMRPRLPPRPSPPAPPAEEEQSDAAGEAAIITAVATGIAGLLGAVTQTVLAFLKMKERRPKDDQS